MIDEIKDKLKHFKKDIQGHGKSFVSSVLIPLVEIDKELYVLFELRSKTLNAQPGEISFPGGKKDEEDLTFMDTAIRETCEELGVKEENIEIITEMDTFVAPFNLIIHPFLGILKDTSQMNVNKAEVDHVFMVPLKYFFDTKPNRYGTKVQVIPDEDFPYEHIPRGRNYEFKMGRYDVLLYDYEGYIIWGITAKIIYDMVCHFKDMGILPDKIKNL